LAKLNDNDSVQIFPYDPRCHEIFESVKQTIQKNLGKSLKVEHHGASSLGISGQNEIDVYIPVIPADFDEIVAKVSTLFGEPKSVREGKMARFKTEVNGKKIDLFVANIEHEEWKRHVKFKTYLLGNPDSLEEYRNVKENMAGKSTREYYKAKLEFINGILVQLDKLSLRSFIT
jgi:GrpB-like predicted nucleotidyltransferase (UPF0157 family)